MLKNKFLFGNDNGSLLVEMSLIIAILIMGVATSLAVLGQDILVSLDKTGDLVTTERHGVTEDAISPTGTISTVGNYNITKNENIQLSLSADDGSTGSGIGGMRLSSDGLTWFEWEEFNSLKNWSISGADGLKSVYVQYKDKMGNTSPIYTCNVTLDTTPPTGILKINDGAQYTNNANVTLNIIENDLNAIGRMRLSQDGETWGGWETFNNTKEWTLTVNEGIKTAYIQLEDEAKNVSVVEIKDTITLDMTNPSITSPTLELVGGYAWGAINDSVKTLKVSNTTAGDESGIAQWEYKINNGAWTTISSTSLTMPVLNLRTAQGIIDNSSNTVSVRATDQAGNISATMSKSINFKFYMVTFSSDIATSWTISYSGSTQLRTLLTVLVGEGNSINNVYTQATGWEFDRWEQGSTLVYTPTLTVDNVRSNQNWKASFYYIDVSSCPFLYVWNGREYAFEADLYPVSRLGALAGSVYTKPNPADYYVFKNNPVVKDGYIETKFTNESAEADYTDEFKMFAIDVPNGFNIASIQPARGGSYVPLTQIVKTVSSNTSAPKATILSSKEDVSKEIEKRDNSYAIINADRETAELDYIELNLGSISTTGPVKLLIDAASWTPITAEGRDKWFTIPAKLREASIELVDKNGNWVAVKTNMGKPGEYQREYLVDLTGKFLSEDSRVRIRYSTSVYIDAIRLDTTEDISYNIQELPLHSANLLEHGRNNTFLTGYLLKLKYNKTGAKFNRWLEGNYTKLGNVTQLLADTDDKFVIMGDGDEIQMQWEPAGELAKGKTRYYVLYVNGYYKYLLTGLAPAVNPLPFRSMSNYPYTAGESYPDSIEHQQYLKEWNTRWYANNTGK